MKKKEIQNRVACVLRGNKIITGKCYVCNKLLITNAMWTSKYNLCNNCYDKKNNRISK